MNKPTPLSDFMRDVDQLNRRNRERDRLGYFREFFDELQKSKASRKAGLGETEYFKRDTFNFLKGE